MKGTITKEQSIFFKKYHHVLLGIGSGLYSRCRKELVQRMAEKEKKFEPHGNLVEEPEESPLKTAFMYKDQQVPPEC